MAFNNSVDASESGFQSITTGGVWHGRTLIAGSGITISNPDGTAGNPTITATGSGPSPNGTVQLVDDFITFVGAPSANYIQSQLPWNHNSFATMQAGTQDHPGIIYNASSAASFGMFNSLTAGGGGPFVFGGGVITEDWVFNINTLSTGTNTYTLWVGFGDGYGSGVGTEASNGAYFEYSSGINSGKWVIKTANGGTRTTTNSSTTVSTGWHHATIAINAAGTSITFTMDGVSLGTITTNIPTSNSCGIIFLGPVTAGTMAQQSLSVDLFYLTQTLTTPR